MRAMLASEFNSILEIRDDLLFLVDTVLMSSEDAEKAFECMVVFKSHRGTRCHILLVSETNSYLVKS